MSGAPTPSRPPSRHDGATTPCPVCGSPFTPSGRRRGGPTAVVVPTTTRSRRAVSVYECPSCDARFVAEQRCGDCGVFARRAGLGGACPHCDEPVTVAELVGDGVVADTSQRGRR